MRYFEKSAVIWSPATIEKAVASRISRAANLDPGQKRDLLRKAKNQLKNLWSEAVNEADSAFVRARYTPSAASRYGKSWNESDAAEASLASIVKARKNVQSLLDN